jgi:hypothetical protein
MKRQDQLLLVGSTLIFSWLAMQAVHEFVHILAAWTTGGQIAEVDAKVAITLTVGVAIAIGLELLLVGPGLGQN